MWLLTGFVAGADGRRLISRFAAGLLCGLTPLQAPLGGRRWRPRLRWVAWLVSWPFSVVAETVGAWRVAAPVPLSIPARAGGNGSFSCPLARPGMLLPLDVPSPPSGRDSLIWPR